MLFEATVVCPMCAHSFRIYFQAARSPVPGELFEVVCPCNGSRFRFFAASPAQGDNSFWPTVTGLHEVDSPGARAWEAFPVEGRSGGGRMRC
jgi:hypothetical protein